MQITSLGNSFLTGGSLGIGTITPNLLLHLHQDNSNATFAHFTNTTTGVNANQGVSFGLDSNEDATIYHYGSKNIRFATGGTEKVRIHSNGNLLLGTTNSTTVGTVNRNLIVGSTTNAEEVAVTLNVMEGTNNRRVKFFLDDDDGVYGVDTTSSTGTAQFVVRHATSEKLRITSGGTVGINDSSPNTYFKLDVNGHTNIVGDIALPTTNRIYFGNSDTAFIKGEHGGSGYLAFGANNEKMRLTRAGRLGIGTDNPGQTLHLSAASGDVYNRVDTNVNGGLLVYVQGTQRGVFANDSAFSGGQSDIGIGLSLIHI